MLGVSSAKEDCHTMIISGIAGTVTAAVDHEKEEALPNPVKVAAASGLAFTVGSVVPLLSCSFIGRYEARVLALVAVTTVALAGFGGAGAYLPPSSTPPDFQPRRCCSPPPLLLHPPSDDWDPLSFFLSSSTNDSSPFEPFDLPDLDAATTLSDAPPLPPPPPLMLPSSSVFDHNHLDLLLRAATAVEKGAVCVCGRPLAAAAA